MSSLIEVLDEIRADAEAGAARAARFTEQHLPVIAETAQALATNPLAQVALRIIHLSPDFLSTLASVIDVADQKLGAAKQAQAEAEAAQQAALDAAQPPDPAADPSAEQAA